jgi:hypothetical protein
MTFPRALAIPAVLVAMLSVVGMWLDRSPTPPAAATASSAPAESAPPTTPPGPPRTSCTSVVHVGDSTSVGLMSPDYIADPALRLDAQYARVGVIDFRNEIRGARSIIERYRGEENADDVAARVKASGYEGCWVLALGTTDAANLAAGGARTARERIERMLAIIGDDPVLWVNVKTLDPQDPAWANEHMEAWNAALAEVAARTPNLEVFDWAAVVEDAWFQDDGIHYTSAGNVERARRIADALLAAFPA